MIPAGVDCVSVLGQDTSPFLCMSMSCVSDIMVVVGGAEKKSTLVDISNFSIFAIEHH